MVCFADIMSSKRLDLFTKVIIVFVICVTKDTISGKRQDPKQLRVRIYYEALCPASMHFVRNHLYPTLIENHMMKYASLQLVPFGRAKVLNDPATGQITVACSHGPEECRKNAFHACLIETTEDRIMEFLMINCLMRSATSDAETCAANLNYNISAANQCLETRSIPDILYKYGNLTLPVHLTFVPGVSFNGQFHTAHQKEILHSFASLFCRQYKYHYKITLKRCAKWIPKPGGESVQSDSSVNE